MCWTFCVEVISVRKNFLFCTSVWDNIPFFPYYCRQFKTCCVNVCEVARGRRNIMVLSHVVGRQVDIWAVEGRLTSSIPIWTGVLQSPALGTALLLSILTFPIKFTFPTWGCSASSSLMMQGQELGLCEGQPSQGWSASREQIVLQAELRIGFFD